MSTKKQSSIDWLEQEFVKLEATVGVHSVMYELIEQAKTMHKVEIMQSLNDGKSMALGTMVNASLEQYYNEIYGGNNE